MPLSRKPRVMIINAYFDPWLSSTPIRLFVPRSMAPYFLAGYFDAERVEVRTHDEAYQGALLDKKSFQWPDLVVLTGLNAMFDRARQLAAYFRHWRKDVKVVIGGPIPRAMPNICQQVFDEVLFEDVNEITQVIGEMFGPDYCAEVPVPRYDLVGFFMGVGSIETSTYCNFKCSFCALTGEKRAYKPHSEEFIDQQLSQLGRKNAVLVLDNNFYGNNRKNFKARTEQIGDYWRKGAFKGWGALVTGDFFKNEDNLEFIANNGCQALFSGVESLEPEVLKSFNKHQSLSSDPRTLALLSAKYGIALEYGMIVDFTHQRIAEVEQQLDYLLADPDIPLPSLLSLTIPIVGTPYFDEAVKNKRLLPNLRLSDMDGQKLAEWPMEPIEKVATFVEDMLYLRGRKKALLRHTVGHFKQRKDFFKWEQLLFNLLRPWHQYNRKIRIGNPRQMLSDMRESKPTYNAMTFPLRHAYKPRWALPERFAEDFKPFMVTDSQGELSQAMQDEVSAKSKLQVERQSFIRMKQHAVPS